MHNDSVNGRSPRRRNGQMTNDAAAAADQNRQGTPCPQDTARTTSVTVLDGFPLYSDPESPQISPPLSAEAESLKLFKVFIKRNLPFEQPAPDLLVRIHKRIDDIKKEL